MKRRQHRRRFVALTDRDAWWFDELRGDQNPFPWMEGYVSRSVRVFLDLRTNIAYTPPLGCTDGLRAVRETVLSLESGR